MIIMKYDEKPYAMAPGRARYHLTFIDISSMKKPAIIMNSNLQISGNHIQMSYYFLMVVAGFFIAYGIILFRQGKGRRWWKPAGDGSHRRKRSPANRMRLLDE